MAFFFCKSHSWSHTTGKKKVESLAPPGCDRKVERKKRLRSLRAKKYICFLNCYVILATVRTKMASERTKAWSLCKTALECNLSSCVHINIVWEKLNPGIWSIFPKDLEADPAQWWTASMHAKKADLTGVLICWKIATSFSQCRLWSASHLLRLT